MRAMWRGAINFGMVTIPVKMYSATEQKDVRFRLVHRKDGAPIVEKRFCTLDDKEVEWDELARGFEVAKGEYLVIEPDEIEEAGPETTRSIDIGDFVELEEIDPIYFEKSYFLEPTDVGVKPFHLLRRALSETARVAVARVAIRNKERLATVRVYDDTLVLETMFWPDEIRQTEDLELGEARAKPSSKEIQMARSLVENLSDRFDPERYEDRYRLALQELIERKMHGEQRAVKRRKPEPKVIDLMAALQASVDAARAGKKPTPASARSAKAPTERKRTAAKRGAEGKRTSERSADRKRSAARRRSAA